MNEDLRKILGTILGIIFFICIAAFMTYALYKWKSSETNVNIGIEDVSCDVSPREQSVTVSGIGPVLDYNSSENIAKNNIVYVDFFVTNNIDSSSSVNINLNITTITDNLKQDYFKYILLRKDTSTGKYSIVVKEGNFSGAVVGDNSIINYTISANNVYYYRFIVYVDGNVYNGTELMDGTLNSSLGVNINCGSV